MFSNLCPLANPSKHICSFNISESICSVNSCKPVRSVDSSNPMCTVDGLRSVRPVTKSVLPVDALRPVRSVNFNKIVGTVNSNTHALVRLVSSSNFVRPVDIHTVNSNKPFHPVNSS